MPKNSDKIADSFGNSAHATRCHGSDTGAPLIEIQGLCHRFADGTPGLDGIDIKIDASEFVVIAGANGCGKTTLLRHLNGLLQPSAGRVYLKGLSVATHWRRARRLVGLVFQDSESQIVGETVWEDVAFGPRNLKWPPERIKQRVDAVLKVLQLEKLAHQPPHLLSGGEKRRLAVAGVLAMQPEVIAFDEPFSNLDYQGTCRLLDQMRRLHQDGHTIVVTTHELERIIDQACRLIVMQRGRVARDGPPPDVLTEVEQFGVRKPCGCRQYAGEVAWPA